VIPGDPNVQRVELVAAALGELRHQLVLVGGCAVSLLIDSATASPPRVTYDVDLIAEVAALREYHLMEKALAERGFVRDQSPDAPICRWTVGAVKVDLMPTSEAVLGFSNPWYKEAMRSATRCTLPSGVALNLISAPAFLATKFEAFDSRGRGDMAASHDFEDIINIVEGCGEHALGKPRHDLRIPSLEATHEFSGTQRQWRLSTRRVDVARAELKLRQQQWSR
jgi:predicted nucleotidyltransferase